MVQSAVIGEKLRMVTDVLGGVADGAAVGVAVGAVWLAEHCVHVCSAVGAVVLKHV